MIIVVTHKINNPSSFWSTAKKSLPELPSDGVQRVLQILPNKGTDGATCVWEADNIETLDRYLRSRLQNWSEECYYEVDTPYTMGLHL